MFTQANPLLATTPHPSLGVHADTFGRIIGSWAGEFRDISDGHETTGEMEVHLAWALDGRAVQDVWIVPSRRTRAPSRLPQPSDNFGSTMRIFDPSIEAWRMFWFDPSKPYARAELIGRRVGDDIVQIGSYGDTPIKWIFSDIHRDAFVWRGYWLAGDGDTWNLSTEFRLERV